MHLDGYTFEFRFVYPFLSQCFITKLPIGSIISHHDIDFHIYADDPQLYASFDLSNSNVVLDRMNLCTSDLQIWMIRNKLKINYLKTEFLIITSSFLKQSFNDLNSMVSDCNIVSSNSARNISLIIILIVFVNHLFFICVTLVAFVVFCLMMHVPNWFTL